MIKLWITPEAYMKLRYYVQQCDKEIQGYGFVRRLESDEFEFYDLFIMKQIVTSASADFTTEDVAIALEKMVAEGKKVEDVCMWWHSHAKMQEYFSGTDTTTIQKATEFDMLFSLVTNHKMDIKARLDLKKPIAIDDIDVQVLLEEKENITLKNRIKKEIVELVSEPPKIENKIKSVADQKIDSWLNQWDKKDKKKIGFNDPIDPIGDMYGGTYNRGDIPYLLTKTEQDDEIGHKKLVFAEEVTIKGQKYIKTIYSSGISILDIWDSKSQKRVLRLKRLADKNVKRMIDEK